jgi:hypothetical protein
MPGKKGGATPQKAPGGITKQEAVRRTLADLGRDAKPTQMQGHIREHYGLEMTVGHISTAKGDILRKQAGKVKLPAARPSATPALPAEPKKDEPTPPLRPAPARQTDAIGLDDIEAVKGLLERVGAPALRKLIDVMAR